LLTAQFAGTDMPLSRTALMGSAAKGTIIRPIDDVDIMAVFGNAQTVYDKYRWDSRKFLYRVREALSGQNVKTVGSRGQAVRLFYVGGGHVDIAPTLPREGGGFLLPAGDGTWITTDPEAGTTWLQGRHATLSYQLKPLVRLVKKWNRTHSSRMGSFHMETVVATTFSSLGSNHRDNLRDFFGWAPQHLTVADPAGHSGLLDTYLTWAARQDLMTNLASSHTRAVNAITAELNGNHEEAMRLWRILLDSEFPAYR